LARGDRPSAIVPGFFAVHERAERAAVLRFIDEHEERFAQ
jgi:hypothetical protein